MKRPGAVDFLDAAVRYPEYAAFMDRGFSCLGYDRSAAPAGFVLASAGKTIGDVLTEMALFKRREPRDGMHSSRAAPFLLDVAKMSGVGFVRFLSVGNCNGMLPSFAVDTLEPFTTLRGSSVQVEALRDLDDYSPGVLDLAALSYAATAQPSMPAPPNKPKVAAGVCALPGCFLPVYGAGYDYCTETHAIQAGALAPLPAPCIPSGAPAWSPPASPPASPFQSPPIFTGFGGQFGGGAPPPLLRSSLPHCLRPLRRFMRSSSLALIEARARAAAARAAARAAMTKGVVAAKVAAVRSPAASRELLCRSTAGACR